MTKPGWHHPCAARHTEKKQPEKEQSETVLLHTPWLSRISVVWRIAAMLLVLVIVPLGGLLALAELRIVTDIYHTLILLMSLALGLIVPISRVSAKFLILNDLHGINQFCLMIQQGNYYVRFDMDMERDDESELVRLKRNMNWMGHQIEAQSRAMRTRLGEVGQRQKFYEEMSYRDPLTKLFNRRYFTKTLEMLTACAPSGHDAYLAMIDCDYFKQVNDRHGHQSGDNVLITLGRIIGDSVRESEDIPFRLGGDEFGVLFRNGTLVGCMAACERIRSRFEKANPFGCTVSIGLAAWSKNPMQDRLVETCDQALYMAKGRGRNCIVSDMAA